MELSESEKRLLQEMETRLLAEDPRLASSLRVHRLRVGARAVLAAAGLAAGVLLMSLGIWRAHLLGIVVALVGFVILLASTTVTVDVLRDRRDRRPPPSRAGRRARGTSGS
jgi:type IV secretory pathway TrbD component